MAEVIYTDYEVCLRVLSPLHIGTGETREQSRKDSETHEVAAVCTGFDEESHVVPYIPGAILKGVMRQSAETLLIPDAVNALFGTIKASPDGDETADSKALAELWVRGRVYFWGGVLDKESVSHRSPVEKQDQAKTCRRTALPYLAEDRSIFMLARTAIHTGRGTSDENKLFNADCVVTNAEFDVRFRVERSERNIQAFERLLKSLATEGGFTLGANSTQGFGRVRFTATSTIDWTVGDNGMLVKGAKQSLALEGAAHAQPAMRLCCTCEGPFYILDPSAVSKAQSKEETEGKFQQKALRDDQLPLIIGSEIKGALRARYAWMLALAGREDADRAVERLFGGETWRGLLIPWVRCIKPGASARTTSVKIDCFSGGAFDSGLFSSEVNYGVSFVLEIGWDSRAQQEDKEALNPLIEDIKQSGIQLGHRTNSGFGWFDVKEVMV